MRHCRGSPLVAGPLTGWRAGFQHSAFTFAAESAVARASINSADVPPGALISFVQKGLQYLELEANLTDVRVGLPPAGRCRR